MAIERMSSKSHIRVRVRAARPSPRVGRRASPRSGDATRTKKIRVARRRGRGPASARVVRARRPVSLSLSSLAPPSRLAPRRPDARASRAGETRRRRVRATTRSGDRRRERARRGREVDGVHPSMIRASAERRARVRPTRRRVSIVAPRRANARWRRAAGARSSRRRVDRVERARVSSSVSSLTTGCPPSVNQSINHITLERSGTASREVDAPRRRAFAMRSRSSHPSTRLATRRRIESFSLTRIHSIPPRAPRSRKQSYENRRDATPSSTHHHASSPTEVVRSRV